MPALASHLTLIRTSVSYLHAQVEDVRRTQSAEKRWAICKPTCCFLPIYPFRCMSPSMQLTNSLEPSTSGIYSANPDASPSPSSDPEASTKKWVLSLHLTHNHISFVYVNVRLQQVLETETPAQGTCCNALCVQLTRSQIIFLRPSGLIACFFRVFCADILPST